MRLLFFEPYGFKTKHFERGLEVMQQRLDEGRDVTVLGCPATLAACIVNFDHDLGRCVACISRRRHGLSLLEGRLEYRSFERLEASDRSRLRAMAGLRIDSMEDLKSFRFEDFDAGIAVASTLISKFRNPHLDLTEHADLVRRMLTSACRVHASLINHLRTGRYDCAYVHNGRHAHQRALWRACESVGVDFVCFEAGHDSEHFMLFENSLPHDLVNREREIRRGWNAADPRERVEIGSRFFEHKRQGSRLPEELHFTGRQRGDLLPEDWDATKKNVVIFNSSGDEVAALGDDWELPFYASQLDGMRRIAESLAPHHDVIRLSLRMHPNLDESHDPDVVGCFSLEDLGVSVVSPTSEISTYAMMEAADVVVTFLSTAGIEAAHMGKPTILLGKPFYRNLGSVYTPAGHAETVELLLKELQPLPPEGALMYGHHMETFGIPHRYYRPDDFYTGKFKGIVVRPSAAADWLKRHALRRGVAVVARRLSRWHRERLC